MRAQSLSHVQLFVTPWTVAHQPPLSMGFPRQEYWSGLPFPLPRDLPNPEIKPASPTAPASVVFPIVFREVPGTGRGLPGGSVVKNLPVMREKQVQSLDREYPLEK